MLVQDFFDQLSYSELGQIDIGGSEESGITPEDYPKLVAAINLGLLALAKRFTIRSKSVDIQEKDTVSEYFLDSTYSIQTGVDPDNYLIDTVADTFSNNDLLKMEYITYVNSYAKDERISFNKMDDEDAILKREFNSFYVPDTSNLRLLTVHYRARLTELDLDTLDPDVDLIDIPPVFIESLLYFVASRLHANRPTLDGQENTSMKYMQLYEKSLQEIDSEGLIEESDFLNEKLDTNGWV